MQISPILLLKFFKFCIVGLSGMMVDFGTTWLLKERLKVNKYIANSSGFTLAVFNNYTWNRLWTFTESSARVGGQLLSFGLIAFVGLLLNNLTIRLLHGKGGFGFYTAKMIAIGVVTVWNFTLNYLITFAQ